MTFTHEDLLRWHPGELEAREDRGFEIEGGPGGLQPGLIYGSGQFLEQLQLFPLTTLDSEGRPWVSILTSETGQPGFIKSLASEGQGQLGALSLQSIPIPPGTPLLEHVRSGKRLSDPSGDYWEGDRLLTASVGVLLTNRRRNKYEGWIEAAEQNRDGTWNLDLGILASMGNCPKYINVRSLLPSSPKLRSSSDNETAPLARTQVPTGEPIPTEVLDVITATDIIYLGTLHSASTAVWYSDRSKLGCNIRGGSPGFLRHCWDEAKQRHCVVMPDFSGNRFMQSLGNMKDNPVAGIAIPVFRQASSKDARRGSGAVYLTCETETFTGSAASAIIRGFKGVTKMWITGYAKVDNSLAVNEDDSLVQHGDAGKKKGQHIMYSPYNPPVRRLASEGGLANGSSGASDLSVMQASLTDAQLHSAELATFSWTVQNKEEATRLAGSYRPGQYVIADAQHLLDTRITLYTHMAQFAGGEKDLNDDGVRSWTCSSTLPWRDGDESWTFTTTLRRVSRGGVTPTLFSMAQRIAAARESEETGMPPWAPKLTILGIQGDFVPDIPEGEEQDQRLYLCSGVGITPLLAHISGIQPGRQADILALVTCRSEELNATQRVLENALAQVASANAGVRWLKVKVHILVARGQSDEESSALQNGEEMPLTTSSSSDVEALAQIWYHQRLMEGSLQSGNTEIQSGSFIMPAKDVAEIPLSSRIAYLCGAMRFEMVARAALRNAGVQDVRSESFTY